MYERTPTELLLATTGHLLPYWIFSLRSMSMMLLFLKGLRMSAWRTTPLLAARVRDPLMTVLHPILVQSDCSFHVPSTTLSSMVRTFIAGIRLCLI
jgi:hypothetical protein